MQNLVPKFILEKYAQGETDGRFDAVCLFNDISGFSTVTHALMQHGNEAAEAMADTMLAIFDPLVQLVHAHGGFITTFAGDAFTALFPIIEEDATYARAMAAAVGIQEYMMAHPVYDTPYGSFSFGIKVGLGDGGVIWGILRPNNDAGPLEQAEVKAAYFFSGPAIEAAAAAEHHAQSGNLILTPAVYAHVRSFIKAIPVGDDDAQDYYRFLSAVGGELPDPLPPAPPDPHTAREQAFVPTAILRRANTGDFRQVVVVFVKLMGIETGQDLAIFMQSVFALQQQLGGYLNLVDFGDKGCTILLCWGMPISYENDVERALNFVLQLSTHTPGTFRAGITYHPLYTGLAGSPDRGAFTCYGDGINLAARLMVAAPWGTIWLDEEAARRAERHFTIEPAGQHIFKGFAQPEAVYALIERNVPDTSQLYPGTLIGREDEMARLRAFVQPLLEDSSDGCAGMLLIEGEAGLGKSRLVAEFLRQLAASPDPSPQWFFCQTDQTLREPLNPFRYWLRTYFEQSPFQSEAHNKRAFNRKLDRRIAALPDQALGKELNRTRSLLGALVDLHWESSLYAQLDPQGRHDLTLTALKNLIQAEAMRQPVIIILEDAQWIDDVSRDFVARLVRTLAAYPLAIIVTTRPTNDDAPAWDDIPHERLDLALMSGEGIIQLAAEIVEHPPDDDLAAVLVERSEGNPFFVEQILFYLQENGTIELRDNQWHVVGALQDTILPPDVRAIFTARLDRLTQDVRDVVQTAAILGREFEIRALMQMLRDDHALGEKITTAEEAAIWAALNQIRYIFKHALLRDAAYKMQLRARRSRLHHTAARAFETLYAGDLAPHYGKIAYHYEAAYQQGVAEAQTEALDYLQKAAQQAAEVYKNATAVDYYSRALSLVPETEIERRFELLMAREEICHLQGARQRQAQDLAALAASVEILSESDKRAVVASRQARYAFATGDYAEAIAAAQATVASAQAARDPDTETAGYVWWASALERSGDESTACARYTQALELARAVGNRRGEGDALRGLGIMAWRQSHLPEAQAHYQQSLALSQALEDRRGEAATLNNLGLVLSEMGEYAQAQAHYTHALAIRRDIGDRAGEGSTLNNLGLLLQKLGSYTEARAQLQKSLAIWREIGSRPGEAVTLDNLGFVSHKLGEYDAAQHHLSTALSLERALGARKAEGWTLNNLGHLYLAQGDYVEAEAHFQKALALRRAAQQRQYVVEDLAGLAQVALAQGEIAKAMAWIDDLWPILEENPTLEGAEHPQQALLACYHVLRAGDDPRAEPLLATLYTQLQERAAKIADADLRRSFLENVPEHRELVRQFTGESTGAWPPPPPEPEPVPAEPRSTPAKPKPAPAKAGDAPPPPDVPAPEPPPAAPTSSSTRKPLQIPLEGLEGEPPVIIIIENLTLNVQGGAGIVVSTDPEDLLRQLLQQHLSQGESPKDTVDDSAS